LAFLIPVFLILIVPAIGGTYLLVRIVRALARRAQRRQALLVESA
jgi:hypothetical protein